MKSFLNTIASHLLTKYGNDLSEVVVVFPNKRASLFLNEELLNAAEGHILWSPRYVTISELFTKFAGKSLVVADHIKLVVELYDVYRNITNTTESLDEFYSWGELLLSDFDDIDKNMGDARLIFKNTSDLHEYDTVTYLTEFQKKTLERFFSSFKDDHESKLKENFIKLWSKLGDIYTQYRQRLKEKGIAYEGMLYRETVENPASTFPYDGTCKFCIAGFNMVHKVEQKLFEIIKEKCSMEYFWDYDEYYMKQIKKGGQNICHEASKYIREYLQHYSNAISEKSVFNNFASNKDITFISASTEDIQARYVSQWLTKERIDAGKRTAIVLCNEALLPTVVNCIPPEVEHVNITTGYPLANTPSASLVQQFFTLYFAGEAKGSDGRKLRLRYVSSMLRHPYMKFISTKSREVETKLNRNHVFFPTIDDIAADDALRTVFTLIGKNGETQRETNIAIADRLMWMLSTIAQNCDNSSPLMQESVFRMYTLLSRIRTLADKDGLDVDTVTFQRLIMQAIKSTSVPFHGEPVIGIQIMGVLETRNLDFDHLLILSCNEGNMPKGINDSSFIPHSVRMAYGLTTVENKVSIYAYYFHRLLQRASDITITYNTGNEGGMAHEGSRFLKQLLAESPLPIKLQSFDSSVFTTPTEHTSLEKTQEVMERLNGFERISPSAINSYLRCQLQFFYKYICQIDDHDEEDEAEIDNVMFGRIFHRAAECLYRPYLHGNMTESTFDSILKDEGKIHEALDRAYKLELFRIPEEKVESVPMPRLDGSQTLKYNIIKRLLKQLLNYDKAFAPICVEGVEDEVFSEIEFEADGKKRSLKLKGIIDRLDVITDGNNERLMRIIDYKTSTSKHDTINSLEEVFTTDNQKNHSNYYLQTMLYGMIQWKRNQDTENYKETKIAPCLIYPNRMRSKEDSCVLKIGKEPITDVMAYKEEYFDRVRNVLSDIFSAKIPFSPTANNKNCENCAYKNLCFSIKRNQDD